MGYLNQTAHGWPSDPSDLSDTSLLGLLSKLVVVSADLSQYFDIIDDNPGWSPDNRIIKNGAFTLFEKKTW